MATIDGSDIGETLDGTSGDDVLRGMGGNDTLNGNGGDDELEGGAGDDRLDGGDGNDTASYASAASMVEVDLRIDGARDTIGAGFDTLVGIENLTGSAHNDRLTGNGGDNLLIGGDGDDRLSAVTGGSDVLRGGAGGDTYVVGQADVTIEETDAFTGSNIDSVWLTGPISSYTLGTNIEALRSFASVGGTLVGNDQDNLIEGSAHDDVIVGGLGDDVLDGYTGVDTVDYSGNVGSGVTLSLAQGFMATATGGAGNDTVSNFENVSGSAFTDTLTGNAVANELNGNGGDDSLSGLGGNDTLRGGAGKDELDGGADNDFLYGDADDDILHGGSGNDNLDGGAGDDKLYADSGIDSLAGGDGNDLLVGGGNSDTLLGGDGDDTLDPGKRTVEGSVDHLDGGAGTNTLSFATQNGVVRVSLDNGAATVANGYPNSTFVNFSNLTGTDLALPFGNPGDTLSGDANDNHIRGLAGDDVLWGGSGGADILEGGEDGDVYIVDTAEDLDNVIIEAAGARGVDFVLTSLASYTLTAANVEGILGTNASGQALTGNESDNEIVGFTGNDSLSGLGGKDTMSGDLGNDEIDGGEGEDTLYGDNRYPDRIGHGDDHLKGGGGDDRLHGEGGDDILDGGAGADAMFGGTGNDVYVVDDSGDTVTEIGGEGDGEGDDEVRTSIANYILPANVERLVYTGSETGTLRGNGLNNTITGSDGRNVFLLQDGGDDSASGQDGTDSFYFGGAFTAADFIDGGSNRDALMLQGDYSGGIAFGTGTTSNIVGVESISLLSGSNTSYGEGGANRYDYRLTMLDSNVAAGALMKVNGFHLLEGEDFTFDGSAETDAGYQIFAGLGLDKLVGGQQNDNFIFGQDGRFATGDTVTGGGGYDVLYLRGNYAIDFNAPGYTGLIAGVESIGLLSAASSEFIGGGGTEFDYNIVWSDTMVGSGQTMTVNGSRLTQTETMIFDGQLESDGNLRLWGGAANDQLKGGNGNDVIYGGKGSDTLFGNGGADTFLYYDVADSAATPGSFDEIAGFTHLVDKIDVRRIDADTTLEDDQAFQFIGDALFSGAGQLRAVQLPPSFGANVWQIEGDTNGDGTPDLLIRLTLEAGQSLTAADFIF